MAVLLVVEDDLATNEAICEYMKSAGHITFAAYDGEQGYQIAKEKAVDLVILDIMLPKLTGLEVLKKLRAESSIPVLMLTALDDEPTQAVSFDEKADDYITKPFSLIIVQKRIEALLRRIPNEDNISILRYKTLKLDCEKYKFYCNGEDIYLTPLEYSIMHLFMQHPRRVFSKEELIEYIWNYSFCGSTNSVNFHIMNMRKKGIEQIETVRGMGYRLV